MDAKIKAFLDMLSWSEGTDTGLDDGYGVIVSGVDGKHTFTDYSDHPFAKGGFVTVSNNPFLRSTAAGRYQLEARWWAAYKKMLKLTNFGHDSQEAVAVQQIKESRALPLIESGDIEGAIRSCSNIWASLPGNSYGEHGGHSMADLIDKYNTFLTKDQA